MSAVTVTTFGAVFMLATATRPAAETPPAELSAPAFNETAERERLDQFGDPPGQALAVNFETAPAPADADDGAMSKAVEKDGLSVSIGVVSRKVHADEQPVLKIRFANTSRRFMPLYDVNNCAKWQVVFTRLGAADTEPKTWRLMFDVIAQRDGPMVNK